MIDPFQNYFFTNLDTHTVDFSQFGVIGANISYVQLYMSERLLRRAIYDWTQYEEDHGRELTVDQRTVTVSSRAKANFLLEILF